MSPISRKSLLAVAVLAMLLTAVVAVPLQASVFQSGVTPTPITPAPPPATCSGFYYRVLPGDTLSRIGARFGVSVSRLQACNGLANPNRIFAGQLLLIPGVGTPTPPPVGGCGSWYTVRSGDTLFSIARRFGTTVWAIMNANHIRNANLIYAGQRLFISCSGGTMPPPVSHGFWYRVQPGDTVSRIAARYGVSTWSIISANHLVFPYTIYIGRSLWIP